VLYPGGVNLKLGEYGNTRSSARRKGTGQAPKEACFQLWDTDPDKYRRLMTSGLSCAYAVPAAYTKLGEVGKALLDGEGGAALCASMAGKCEKPGASLADVSFGTFAGSSASCIGSLFTCYGYPTDDTEAGIGSALKKAKKEEQGAEREAEENEAGEAVAETADYASFSLEQLKDACRAKGLPVGGTKPALRARLEAAAAAPPPQ
jgi:hypothetical protein